MDMPDSAVSYYLKAEDLCKDTLQLPRILFVLSELARIDSVKTPLSSSEYLKSIIREYPESPYANQARRNLKWAVVEEKADSAKGFYEQGERFIDEGRYKQALETLSEIEKRYPLSPLAAKSIYAKGWIYEYGLKDYDSAAVQYKILERKYTSSYFARVVHGRSLEESSNGGLPDTLKRTAVDTVKRVFPGMLRKTPADTVKRTLPDTLKRTTSDTVKRVSPDTLKRNAADTVKSVFPDTLKGTVPNMLKNPVQDTVQKAVPIQQRPAAPAGKDTTRKGQQAPIMVD